MKKLSFLAFLLLLTEIVSAQILQPIRKEYLVDEEYGHVASVYPDTKSALITYLIRDKKNDVFYWNLELINEKLDVVKKEQLSYSEKLSKNLTYSSGSHYYIFHYNPNSGEYDITDVNTQDLSIKKQTGKMLKRVAPKEMTVYNNIVYISTFYSVYQHIFVIDLATNVLQEVFPKELTKEKLVYTDMELVSTPDNSKEMVFKYQSCTREGCEYVLIRFDANGKKIDELFYIPKPDADKEITFLTLTKDSPSSYLVTGTYGASKKKVSNGIFFSRISNGKTEFIKYYNFLDLNNFTSFLSQRQQDKLERKKDRKEEAGKELLVNFNVTIHDVKERNGEYVFLGEFYYPTYRTETYTTSGANGQMMTHTRQVFDGYQYSHAALAGFDKTGNLTWSNSFEMWLDYKPFSVKQFIRMGFDGDNTELVFATGSKIKSVSFQKNKQVKNRDIEIVKTSDESDLVKRTYGSNIVWWFGQNYLSSGEQIIKNKDNEPGNKKRDVFYINKIAY